MLPYTKMYCKSLPQNTQTLALYGAIILCLITGAVMQKAGDVRLEKFRELMLLEDEYKGVAQTVYAYDYGEIDDKIEKERDATNFMVNECQKEIDKINRLYQTGQIPRLTAQFRINRENRKIVEYEEEFQDFIVHMEKPTKNGELNNTRNKKVKLESEIAKLERSQDPDAFGISLLWKMSGLSFLFGVLVIWLFVDYGLRGASQWLAWTAFVMIMSGYLYEWFLL